MKKWKDYLIPTLLILILLIVWEIGARIVGMSFILPSPTEIVRKLWELRNTLFLEQLPATFLIVVIGLAISIV